MLVVAISMGLIFVMSLYRIIRGPSFQDRLLGLSQTNVVLILSLCVLSVYWEKSFYIDVGVVYALLSFGEIAAFVKLHKKKGSM